MKHDLITIKTKRASLELDSSFVCYGNNVLLRVPAFFKLFKLTRSYEFFLNSITFFHHINNILVFSKMSLKFSLDFGNCEDITSKTT
jgi:hypothetical protein